MTFYHVMDCFTNKQWSVVKQELKVESLNYSLRKFDSHFRVKSLEYQLSVLLLSVKICSLLSIYNATISMLNILHTLFLHSICTTTLRSRYYIPYIQVKELMFKDLNSFSSFHRTS